ncbi:hypothetical protein GKE82_05000 [Conexibacter sp. W3-3-2]|uniref:hypothetical protein n=1 Tax=Conexibacter sp. W3-3-2 TaxID=2675227 RepID=UPI0012B786F3|nr:hypothetical protein [Conexibacter sp. W3-3-2]MTD43679.1 hypothetical protein [Conexibacter sp. W3-3-2]
MLALLVVGCGADETVRQPESAEPQKRAALVPVVTQAPEPLPSFAQYEPGPEERFPNAKRVAGQAAQNLLTYERGATRAAIAARLGLGAEATRQLTESLGAAVKPNAASVAEVIYPQMAGTTATSFGAMVVVRQLLQDAAGRRNAVTRTVDVRLRRSGGPWTVQEIASVGGNEVERPRDLPHAASRLLDDDRVTLTDTARWDIFRGAVDPALLEALSRAAERHRFSVAVLSSGHPRNVWQTDRRSAHSSGYAADIYAVDGRLVVRQPGVGTAAHQLAQSFAGSGVRQLGSPWDFDGPGRASFTDDVHLDHLHVQRSAVGETR